MFKETIRVFKNELANVRYHFWKKVTEIGESKQDYILNNYVVKKTLF